MKLLCNEWTRPRKWTRSPASDVGGDGSTNKGWRPLQDTRGGLPEETEPLGDQNKLQKDKRTVFRRPRSTQNQSLGCPAKPGAMSWSHQGRAGVGRVGGGGGGQPKRGRRGWQDTTSLWGPAFRTSCLTPGGLDLRFACLCFSSKHLLFVLLLKYKSIFEHVLHITTRWILRYCKYLLYLML